VIVEHAACDATEWRAVVRLDNELHTLEFIKFGPNPAIVRLRFLLQILLEIVERELELPGTIRVNLNWFVVRQNHFNDVSMFLRQSMISDGDNAVLRPVHPLFFVLSFDVFTSVGANLIHWQKERDANLMRCACRRAFPRIVVFCVLVIVHLSPPTR
jgi:hypothetical protein